MPTIRLRLSFPAETPLDEVVRPFSALRQAAELLPVRKVSPLLLLGPEYSQRIDVERSHEHRDLMVELERRVPLRYDFQGKPLLTEEHQATIHICIRPRRIVGLQVQPAFGCKPLYLIVADYAEKIQVPGIGAAVNQPHLLPTGLAGWSGEFVCKTGDQDSSLIGYMTAYLTVIALLDAAEGLGISVKVSDSAGYWRNKLLVDLIKEFPGINPPNWVDDTEHIVSLRNLTDLTCAADPEVLPRGKQ